MILENENKDIGYVIIKEKRGINCTFRYNGTSMKFIETHETLPAYLDTNADQLGVFVGIESMDPTNKLNFYYNAFIYMRLYSLSMVEKIMARTNFTIKRVILDKIFSLMGIREASLVLRVTNTSDNESVPHNVFSEFKQALVEMLISSLTMYPIKLDALTLTFDHAINYGVASGIDIFFRPNPATDKKIVFRLKEDDYINPKNFKIWAMASTGWTVDISNDAWVDFVKFVISKATKSFDDPIAPPLVVNLCERLRLGNIYGEKTDEYVEAITSGGSIAVGLLEGDTLTVSAALVMDVITRLKSIKQRQARQMMIPFLIDSDSGADTSSVTRTFTIHENGKSIPKTVKVWRFSWSKLIEIAPELENKTIISSSDKDEQNE